MNNEQCKTCRGQGYHVKETMIDFGRGERDEVPCPTCAGRGVVYTQAATPAATTSGAAGTIAAFVPQGYANETEWLRQQLADATATITAHDALLGARDAELARLRAAPVVGEPHHDDHAVECFADAMKQKMAASRAKGRGGWADPDKCTEADLQGMLAEHLKKGDPVDVGNFAMMLWYRGERTAPHAAKEAGKVDEVALEDLANHLEDEAQPYEGDFADTVRGHIEALRELAALARTTNKETK